VGLPAPRGRACAHRRADTGAGGEGLSPLWGGAPPKHRQLHRPKPPILSQARSSESLELTLARALSMQVLHGDVSRKASSTRKLCNTVHISHPKRIFCFAV
jgi:hypothetical protein